MAGIDGDGRVPAETETEIRDVPPWKPSGHELAIMLTLAVISLMVSVDATIIITSLSTIIQAFNTSTTQGLWVGTAYLLTCAVTMPFIASLSDIFGRPRCLFASLLVFTTGSVLCAVAHSMRVLLAGRSIQGVGGGGIIILSLVIFTDIVPLRSRPQYVGITQVAWAIGTCIGPVLGGAFATPSLWRWVFYLMFPFCAVGLTLVPLVVRLKPRSATLREMFTRVDWIGALLFIPSATGFLIAISWGGTQFPWSDAAVVVPLVVGFLGLVATVVYERFYAKEPFLRHSLFQSRSSFALYAGAFVQGLLLYGQLYYIPLFFESVRSYSPIRTGVSMLAVMLTLIPAALVTGRLISRTGTYRWAIWTGWALVGLGTGLTIVWDAGTSAPVWAVSLVVVGLGHGLLLNALNTAAQAVCMAGDEGAATAMYAFLRSFGMALGVGIGGSVFQNVMRIKLRRLHLPVDVASPQGAEETFVDVLGHLMRPAVEMSPPRRADVLVSAYVYGLRGVFGFFCGLAGLALVVSAAIRHFNIDRHVVTDHTLDVEGRLASSLNRLGRNRTPGQMESRAAEVIGHEA
ncbi:hypothetical protein PV08_09498 [Exophiala spinifera]|uniref:Major facilitator superfamily (MFS) profile domain-containing protein n=1 Tax=Exophiala spinifera TaxID=91928 RepID=A0A0D1ZGZ2_9EURO|nr:uncharacterized protein PV08_09498 [Exophiala spinifera]KIW12222.1 hypothetical protein PV08_09498 [Exophiala spinifera]